MSSNQELFASLPKPNLSGDSHDKGGDSHGRGDSQSTGSHNSPTESQNGQNGSPDNHLNSSNHQEEVHYESATKENKSVNMSQSSSSQTSPKLTLFEEDIASEPLNLLKTPFATS